MPEQCRELGIGKAGPMSGQKPGLPLCPCGQGGLGRSGVSFRRPPISRLNRETCPGVRRSVGGPWTRKPQDPRRGPDPSQAYRTWMASSAPAARWTKASSNRLPGHSEALVHFLQQFSVLISRVYRSPALGGSLGRYQRSERDGMGRQAAGGERRMVLKADLRLQTREGKTFILLRCPGPPERRSSCLPACAT